MLRLAKVIFANQKAVLLPGLVFGCSDSLSIPFITIKI